MSIITWLADHLFAARRRASEIGDEIAEHNAEAAQIQTDLDRWTDDHARKVEQTFEGTKNRVAAAGHVFSGTMRNQLEHVMVEAQEQFRNEASEKVRAFKRLARAEGDGHARRRDSAGPTLRLTEEQREAVASWRERDYPIPDTGESPLRPRDLIGEDSEIAPLLEPEGLTWEAAARPPE